MSDPGSSASALETIAVRCLATLRVHRAHATAFDVLRELGLPATARFLDLAMRAGFTTATVENVSTALRQRILAASAAGVWSSVVIAEELECPHATVLAVLASGGYGIAPFGASAYSRSMRRSDGTSTVRRRVSLGGQLTYRRCTYVIGRGYRGRVASILDEGRTLIATFGDRPSLRLDARDWKPGGRGL